MSFYWEFKKEMGKSFQVSILFGVKKTYKYQRKKILVRYAMNKVSKKEESTWQEVWDELVTSVASTPSWLLHRDIYLYLYLDVDDDDRLSLREQRNCH